MSANRPTLLFMGTPEFAVPTLKSLLELSLFQVAGVVTQPDKPVGRGRHLSPSPVKQIAIEYAIPVYQPQSLKGMCIDNEQKSAIFRQLFLDSTKRQVTDEEMIFVQFLNTTPIDVIIVVAYGKIIPPVLLEKPKCGILNIHASLLPRWRGAAPIEWAIFSGDSETGVSLMKIDEGLDSGPVYATKGQHIGVSDTSGTIHDKLSQLGRDLLLDNLSKILHGQITAFPQSNIGITYASKWEKKDRLIHWCENAERTVRRVRASDLHLGAFTTYRNAVVKVFSAHIEQLRSFQKADPGTIVECNPAGLVVASGDSDFVALDEMQFPGKKRLWVRELIHGRYFQKGDRFI